MRVFPYLCCHLTIHIVVHFLSTKMRHLQMFGGKSYEKCSLRPVIQIVS